MGRNYQPRPQGYASEVWYPPRPRYTSPGYQQQFSRPYWQNYHQSRQNYPQAPSSWQNYRQPRQNYPTLPSSWQNYPKPRPRYPHQYWTNSEQNKKYSKIEEEASQKHTVKTIKASKSIIQEKHFFSTTKKPEVREIKRKLDFEDIAPPPKRFCDGRHEEPMEID